MDIDCVIYHWWNDQADRDRPSDRQIGWSKEMGWMEISNNNTDSTSEGRPSADIQSSKDVTMQPEVSREKAKAKCSFL